MIAITAQMRLMCFTKPVDFRKGIDGLVGVCRTTLKDEDPFSGTVFLFINRSSTTLKIIVYDGQGFWLCMKRLSKGRFHYWPKDKSDVSRLLARDIHVILWNGDPRKALMGSDFRELAQST